MTSSAYTAAQIARVLGKARPTVVNALAGIRPDGGQVVSGNYAQAWSFAVLPAALQADLESSAQRLGYRNAAAMLADPNAAPRWQPPRPLNEIPQLFHDKAVKLQSALAPALAQFPAASGADFFRQAGADYARIVGHAITERHLRRLVERAIERDRGAREWTRVDLFIEDAAFSTKPAPARAVARTQHVHTPLDDVVNHLEKRDDPTADDSAHLFDRAFRHFGAITAEIPVGPDHRRGHTLAKRSLLHYLFSAVPALAKTPKALREMFNVKLRQWRAGGRLPSALDDGRKLNSGNFSRPELADDLKKIRVRATQLWGNESLAHRELRQAGKLSEAFTGRYHFDPRTNKSYLPRSVRNEITRDVDTTLALMQGEQEALVRGPYTRRDWGDTQPGDYFSGDDVTWNSYFYYYDPGFEGEREHLHITRGECLVLTDLRTNYPLGFMLIAGKYNSRHIRSLILRVHNLVGLPRIGFYLENAVWRAKMINGDGKLWNHWRETEAGLARSSLSFRERGEMDIRGELGLREPGLDMRMRNATIHRAKPIEGAFRIIQDHQRAHPGYVGPDEKKFKIERMQEALARCKSGKENPANHLLSMEQWNAQIKADLEAFANDPQNGRMNPGRSPAESWARGIHGHPLKQLPEEDLYFLASHKKEVPVTQQGIVMQINGVKTCYANEQLGKLNGRKVLARWHIDYPHLLFVTDPNSQKHFAVKGLVLPATTATPEQFAEVEKARRGYMKPARALFGDIEHRAISTLARDTLASPASKELGRFINAEVEQHKLEASANERKLARIQRTAAAAGLAVPENIRNPDRVARGLELQQEALARIAQLEQQPKDGSHE